MKAVVVRNTIITVLTAVSAGLAFWWGSWKYHAGFHWSWGCPNEGLFNLFFTDCWGWPLWALCPYILLWVGILTVFNEAVWKGRFD